MQSLFPNQPTKLDLPDAEFIYFPEFICPDEATKIFKHFRDSLAWKQNYTTFYGKTVRIPRMEIWYSTKPYTYSGMTLQPERHMTYYMWSIQELVKRETGYDFNSLLMNYYRDGNDSVAFHADDEPSLGDDPVIASLSLGAERKFQLKHVNSRKITELTLENGSLLLMGKGSQKNYWHSLLKTKEVCGERINLTFRYIHG